MCTEPGMALDIYVAKLLIGLKGSDFYATGNMVFSCLISTLKFYTMFIMKFVKLEQNKISTKKYMSWDSVV